MSRTLRSLALIALICAVGLALAQNRGGTLVAAWAQDPVGLDPHVTSAASSYQVLEQVLDTLVILDDEGNVQPSLATDWSVSEDALEWTFQLRDDVVFHNGRQMTADDVVYTYERLLDPEFDSGNAWRIDVVEEIEAVDDTTVRFTLASPYAPFLTHLGMDKSMGIIARESVEEDTINTRPIGTGPFVIEDYDPGTRVRLVRNEDYWRTDEDGEQLPYLDGVDIQIVTDADVRRSGLVAGDIDWAFEVPPQALGDLEANDEVVVSQSPAGAYWYLGVNTEREPLDDVRVRQAISYALDREQITEAATFGTGTPTQDPIPSSSAWSFDYTPFDQDQEQARALLEEAGLAGGFEVELMPTTQYDQSIRISQVVQSQLAQVDVQASIRTLEWAEWLEEEGAGNYDIYVCSWNGLVDPDDYFYAQHKTGEGFNFTGYSNPTVDELLEEGRTAQGFEERYDIYEEVNRTIVDEAPYIYLYNLTNTQAFRSDVRGYQARPDQAMVFVDVWLDR